VKKAQKEEKVKNIGGDLSKEMIFQVIRFSIFLDIFIDFCIFVTNFGHSLGTVDTNLPTLLTIFLHRFSTRGEVLQGKFAQGDPRCDTKNYPNA